jgi:DNA (cytosine-5)-methyltransferase 1
VNGRPRLLDLFCKAGGAAMGYHRAGFDIVGVDIEPQPRYPFPFVQADAMEVLERLASGKGFNIYGPDSFDAIHASPPCQRYSVATKSIPGLSESHPDLVPATRSLLLAIDRPYVIENVMGAPLRMATMFCGSMFGLLVQRHRLFESSVLILSPGQCRHGRFNGNYPCGRSNGSARAGERSKVVHVYGSGCSRGPRGLWAKAMGIDWMTMQEMAQAIPPAYTEYLGRHLLPTLAANGD